LSIFGIFAGGVEGKISLLACALQRHWSQLVVLLIFKGMAVGWKASFLISESQKFYYFGIDYF
jgi:hypothetical protein